MNKVLGLLGFASKAGKLIANDVSPKSQKEVLFFGDKFKTKTIVLDECDMQTLSHAVGRKCGIISVNDDSFSQGLLSAINAGRNLNDK